MLKEVVIKWVNLRFHQTLDSIYINFVKYAVLTTKYIEEDPSFRNPYENPITFLVLPNIFWYFGNSKIVFLKSIATTSNFNKIIIYSVTTISFFLNSAATIIFETNSDTTTSFYTHILCQRFISIVTTYNSVGKTNNSVTNSSKIGCDNLWICLWQPLISNIVFFNRFRLSHLLKTVELTF